MKKEKWLPDSWQGINPGYIPASEMLECEKICTVFSDIGAIKLVFGNEWFYYGMIQT